MIQKIFTTRVKTNLNGVLQMTQMINGIMMTGDNAANQIIVELYNDFDKFVIPADTKIVGYFIRSDGYTIEVDGSVNEEGEAVVVIPEAAYQVSGSMSIAVRLFDDLNSATYRGYYKIVLKRGYYDSEDETHPFVEVTDTSQTEGPHGEVIKEYTFSSGEFIQVTDSEQTEGPNGEPVVETTFDIWGTKIVIATLTCYVRITESDSLLDEYHHIPDVQELLAYIEALDRLKYEINENELIREEAETTRQTNESTRQSNETTRESNETTRKSNETTRKSNENARTEAEDARVEAENARVEAEQNREASQAAHDYMIDGMTAGLKIDKDAYIAPKAEVSVVDDHKHIEFTLPKSKIDIISYDPDKKELVVQSETSFKDYGTITTDEINEIFGTYL